MKNVNIIYKIFLFTLFYIKFHLFKAYLAAFETPYLSFYTLWYKSKPQNFQLNVAKYFVAIEQKSFQTIIFHIKVKIYIQVVVKKHIN